jgi:SAM-dependent methyltransferase
MSGFGYSAELTAFTTLAEEPSLQRTEEVKEIANRLLGSNERSGNDRLVLLDAGCGTGGVTSLLRRVLPAEVEIVALDQTRSVCVVQERALQRVYPVQGSIFTLPFPYSKFDMVFSDGVIHYLPDPSAALKSLVTSLRHGGTSYVWVYPRKGWAYRVMQRIIMSITTRLPGQVLYILSMIAAPLLMIFPGTHSSFSFSISNWRQCARVFYTFYCPPRLRWYSIEEVEKWFEDAGFNRYEQIGSASGVWGAFQLPRNQESEE